MPENFKISDHPTSYSGLTHILWVASTIPPGSSLKISLTIWFHITFLFSGRIWENDMIGEVLIFSLKWINRTDYSHNGPGDTSIFIHLIIHPLILQFYSENRRVLQTWQPFFNSKLCLGQNIVSLYQFYSEICCMLQAGKVFGSLASLWTGEHWRKSLAVVNSEMRETCSLWNEKRGRNGEEIVTAGMRDKLNIDCHPLFGGLGYLMLKNFAAYFIKTSILNKNSIKSIKWDSTESLKAFPWIKTSQGNMNPTQIYSWFVTKESDSTW